MAEVAFPMDPLIPQMDPKLIAAVSKKPAILRSVLKQVAEAIRDYIISNWPVDTGTSLAGWGTRPAGQSWEVFNPVEYTSHVHDELAEKLYDQAMGRAVAPANALLKVRVTKAAGRKTGTRTRRAVTPQDMGRTGRATRRVITDKAVIRKATAQVSNLNLPRSLATTVSAHVRAGRIEAAMAALVSAGKRTEARRLARAIQTG